MFDQNWPKVVDLQVVAVVFAEVLVVVELVVWVVVVAVEDVVKDELSLVVVAEPVRVAMVAYVDRAPFEGRVKALVLPVQRIQSGDFVKPLSSLAASFVVGTVEPVAVAM